VNNYGRDQTSAKEHPRFKSASLELKGQNNEKTNDKDQKFNLISSFKKGHGKVSITRIIYFH
jgi:hypothetical protein